MPALLQNTPGRRLREAWSKAPLMVPGTFMPLAAKLAERMGFPAVYLSGAALSASLGLPDVGLVTLTEFVDAARTIVRATSLPLITDADTGFGEAVNVERAVQLFEEAGVAALHLEDQVLPKRCGHLSGKTLVGAEEMVRKVRSAVAARRSADFVVIARTDARSVEGFAAAVERAQRYLDAGADVIFPEALENEDEFARFASAVRAPLLANVTEFGKSPIIPFQRLGEMGYRIVIYPVTTLRSAMGATRQVLQSLLDQGDQRAALPQMMTRQELYDLLGYAAYEARDRSYFGGSQP